MPINHKLGRKPVCYRRPRSQARHLHFAKVSCSLGIEPQPLILPVETLGRRGFSFVVGPSLVVTCDHIVSPRDGDVLVAGTAAHVVSRCPADLALLQIAPLSLDPDYNFPFRKLAYPRSIGQGVVISNAGGARVSGRLLGLPTIMYGSSGAVLSSLQVEIPDEGAIDESQIEAGWSGSPVTCEETGAVFGIVAHGSRGEPSISEPSCHTIHAVPADIIKWFIDSYKSTHEAWYDMGAFTKVFVQPLRTAEGCHGLSREVRSIVDRNNGGVKVIRAPIRSGLLPNDVILRVEGHDVDLDGNITLACLKIGLTRAVLGKRPEEVATVLVARQGESCAVVDEVEILLGSASEAILGVGTRDNGCRLVASNGLRLAELSLDWLVLTFGKEWQQNCGRDLLAVVEGLEGAGVDGESQRHVVVEYDGRVQGQESAECGLAGRDNLQGMRILSVEGKVVRTLNDVEKCAAGVNGGEREEEPVGNDVATAIAKMQNGDSLELSLPLRRTLVESG